MVERLDDDNLRQVVEVFASGKRPAWGPDGQDWSWWLPRLAADLLEARATIATYEGIVERVLAGEELADIHGEPRWWDESEGTYVPVSPVERALLEGPE